MMHNNKPDLEQIKHNFEEAIQSKMLILGSGSGRCEQHAHQFNELLRGLESIEKMISQIDAPTAAEEATVSPAKKIK